MRKHSNDRTIWLRTLAVGIVASLSAGCGYLMQARDHAQPVAVSAMKDAQTLNPEAGRNQKAVAGLGGAAAGKVNEAYVQSFGAADTAGGFQGTEGLGQ